MDNRYTIGVRDFITRFQNGDDEIFKLLPEFDFISYVAAKVRANGCTCGLGPEIGRITEIFNKFVVTIPQELADRTKEAFNIPRICFAIQTKDSFDRICF